MTTGPDDLFQPTLTDAHDIVGIHRPWSPWHLVLLAFFVGFFVGGILIAMNFRRLGIQGWYGLTLMAAVAYLVVMFVVPAVVTHRLANEASRPMNDIEQREGASVSDFDKLVIEMERRRKLEDSKFLVGTTLRALSALLAMAFVSRQHGRYRLVEVHHLPRGRLLKPVLLAIAASFVIWWGGDWLLVAMMVS